VFWGDKNLPRLFGVETCLSLRQPVGGHPQKQPIGGKKEKPKPDPLFLGFLVFGSTKPPWALYIEGMNKGGGKTKWRERRQVANEKA